MNDKPCTVYMVPWPFSMKNKRIVLFTVRMKEMNNSGLCRNFHHTKNIHSYEKIRATFNFRKFMNNWGYLLSTFHRSQRLLNKNEILRFFVDNFASISMIPHLLFFLLRRGDGKIGFECFLQLIVRAGKQFEHPQAFGESLSGRRVTSLGKVHATFVAADFWKWGNSNDQTLRQNSMKGSLKIDEPWNTMAIGTLRFIEKTLDDILNRAHCTATDWCRALIA